MSEPTAGSSTHGSNLNRGEAAVIIKRGSVGTTEKIAKKKIGENCALETTPTKINPLMKRVR
jgi:hypothetical protein